MEGQIEQGFVRGTIWVESELGALVKAGATMGDIVEKLKGVWGTYRETPLF